MGKYKLDNVVFDNLCMVFEEMYNPLIGIGYSKENLNTPQKLLNVLHYVKITGSKATADTYLSKYNFTVDQLIDTGAFTEAISDACWRAQKKRFPGSGWGLALGLDPKTNFKVLARFIIDFPTEYFKQPYERWIKLKDKYEQVQKDIGINLDI
jgi:hypothetical protein